MKTQEEIKKVLKESLEKREMLSNIYNKLMEEVPDCPNQYENIEYKMINQKVELLFWVLSK